MEDLPHLHAAVLVFFRKRLPPGRKHFAEDLAQDTIIAALDSWRRSDEVIENPRAFVLKIARDRWISFGRGARWKHETPLDPQVIDGLAAQVRQVAAEARLIEQEHVARLRRLLSRLPLLERAMVEGALAGLAHKDLCRAIGLEPAEGSRVAWRAHERLRFEMRVPARSASARRSRRSEATLAVDAV